MRNDQESVGRLAAAAQELRERAHNLYTDLKDHRKAAGALRKSARHYKAAMQTAEFVTIVNRQGRIRYVNRPLPELPPGKNAGALVYDHLDAVSAQRLRAAVERAVSAEETGAVEIEWPRPVGPAARYSCRVTPLKRDQRVVAVIIAAVDAGEQKRTEQAIEESEARSRLVSEIASDYIYAIRLLPDGSMIRDWGAGAIARITGYEWEELDRLGWANLIHPEDRENALQQFREMALEGKRAWAEYRILTRTGSVRWIRERARGEKDAEGTVRIHGSGQDVTERVLADAARRKTESQWQSLVAAVPAVIIIFNREAQIEYINHTVAGLEVSQVVGTDAFAYIDPEFGPIVKQCFDTVLQTRAPASCECRALGPHGTRAWYHSRYAPLLDGDELIGIVLVAVDITEQKEAELKLQSEQELLAHLLDLSERERKLLAQEIHDNFVQNLVGAQMMLQSIVRGVEEGKPLQPDQMTSVVGLLDAMIDEGRRKINQLHPLILDEQGLVAALEFLLAEMFERNGFEVAFQHQGDLAGLQPLLKQNLFRIAQEALTNVRLHSGAHSARLSLCRHDATVELEVADEGAGFDPQQVPRGRFGLKEMQERVRPFGGRVEVESSPGSGTRLLVQLPISGF